MAEDEGKKEEEKFEFTPEGEVLGYISLAQARLLAMQTARETPGNYGRRFRGVTMAFEVVDSSEDEDYYNITLSFRAEGPFTEASGREQFFIGKEGAVAYRQVLDVPKGGGRWPRIVVTGGIIVVVLAVALGASSIFGSGPFGAPPSLTPTTESTPNTTPVPTPTEIVSAVFLPTDTSLAATLLPTHTDTPTPTSASLPVSTPLPTHSSDSATPIRAAILEIQCGPEFKLPVHVSIKDEAGIASYSVWSTWGSPGMVERVFAPPYPTSIDEVVILDEENSDTIDRIHEIGLRVVSPGVAEPFITYGLEPNDRCPGHFRSPSSAAPITP